MQLLPFFHSRPQAKKVFLIRFLLLNCLNLPLHHDPYGPPCPPSNRTLLHSYPTFSENLSQYWRSEEHTSELQSRFDLVCRLLLEKKKQVYAHNSVSQLKSDDF